VDGTGGLVRMKSSYKLRNITVRTHYADGSDVVDGPAVNSTYPLGLFREDYEYVAPSAQQSEYLDEHNGRFCVTPEYPNGIYCYFATVDAQWNSSYPYVVGPTYYGVRTASKVTSVTEAVTTYVPQTNGLSQKEIVKVSLYPNPSSDLLVVQIAKYLSTNVVVELMDLQGRVMDQQTVYAGSTMAHFDLRKMYSGDYLVRVNTPNAVITERVVVLRD
jgi:hypothetical protein